MLKTKPHIPLSEEEKASKAKLYRKIAVISLVILLLSLLSAFIFRPQNLNVDTSQIEMVSVKVVDAVSKNERFCKLDDNFYPTEQDAVYGLENQSTSIINKISLPLAFIAFIVSISFFFGYLKNRNLYLIK